MLLFSTILSINKMTKDSFIQLVIEWNQGSPYQQNIIPGIEWHGEYSGAMKSLFRRTGNQ